MEIQTQNTSMGERQTNSFKLMKMSKGYNWECKVFNDDIEVIKEKIKELDNWAVNNWGGQNE